MILVIVALLGVGLFIFFQTSIVKGEMYACTENSDCVSVSADCCGCSAMGTATAVNKNFKSEWEGKMRSECMGTGCLMAVSQHPSCFAKPRCVFGMCRL